MNNDQWYIERNEAGNYSARKGAAKRASAIEPTQADAIKRAKWLDGDAPIYVERVRNTKRGVRDKWRKP
jgi:hypothetical protein